MDGSRVIKLAPKGATDLVGAFRGRMLAPEIKQPGRPLRREQETWRAEMLAAGALHFVWSSAEEAVEELIRAFDLDDQRAEIEARAIGPESELARARASRRRKEKTTTARRPKPGPISTASK